ncbi:NarL family two-component system sensor histidine kinase LiaS [Symbiobacterium terraclitae]|uniref:Sensor histidine kinase n=1 Tax=Symbiobacterium terraclitae TaxID=557451 RepID=A0ABS4JQB7_9FIRM|nr:histidine kinase [Symbiobacterium terraclitae]MBP2017739.1 NarL family two-component system sensor histidine kinase LiaS [Symbiobacterium terraclitae]
MNRLINMQWRLTLFGAAVAAGAAALALVIVAGAFELDLPTLLAVRWLGTPVLPLGLGAALALGLLAGYWIGNRTKRRLERIIAAILQFERGHLSHRLPPLGEDEIGLVATHLNEMARRVERQVASLQRLTAQQAGWQEQVRRAAVAEERQRLARELHDSVSQQLFAISMLTSAVVEQVPDDGGPLRRQLKAVEEMAARAQDEMRALLLHLRPAVLEGKGLKEGLDDLLRALQERQSLQIRWAVDDLPPLPKGIEDHLFRIAQEGLSNVLRHARARTVTLRVHAGDRQIRLKIVDDGVGFVPEEAKGSSYGLQSIHERASEIGGAVEVVSVPGRGTQLTVTVPIVDQGERAE